MPKRPRSHEIEDISRGRLRDLFSRLGWVVWDLHPDYGEDLLVRIFTNGTATHYSFFVQAKATDHLDRYLDKEGRNLSYPIDVDHLQHWEQFWEPVILTVWDATSDNTYWQVVQDYLQPDDVPLSRKKTRISIPISNILDDQGLKSIFNRTISRFQRFELTCEGMSILVELIESRWGVKVEYKPGGEALAIFYPSEDQHGEGKHSTEVFLLGDLATTFGESARRRNMTMQQAFEEALAEHIKRG